MYASHSIALFLIVFSCTLGLHASSRVSSSPTLQVSSDVSNEILGADDAGIPANFDIIRILEESSIPPFSCFESTVAIMLKLGLEDFNGVMKEVSWYLEGYREVGIRIMPMIPNGLIQRRFAIWGLAQSVNFMIQEHKLVASTYELQWNTMKVGNVRFIRLSLPPIRPSKTVTGNAAPSNDAQMSTQSSDLEFSESMHSFPNTTSEANLTGIFGNEDFKIQASLVGRVLDPYRVYYTIISVLTEASQMAPSRLVEQYTSPADIQDLELIFLPPLGRPRLAPPFFSKVWLMQAVPLITQFLLSKGVFRECSILVEVMGVRVADGWLGLKDKGKDGGLVEAVTVGANVSGS